LTLEPLLDALTLQEKAALTVRIDLWSICGAEHLGILKIQMTDGPNRRA